MLKIYGLNFSFPANKVRFAANYLGLDYEYKEIDLRAGEGQSDWYKAVSPAGKIPGIDDDGFTLFESDAICKYLAKKHKSKLYPETLKEQAVVDAWIDFISKHVGNGINKVLFNRLLAPTMGMPVDETSLADGEKFLKRFLPVVDAQLAKHPYVTGSELTLADISLRATYDPVECAPAKIDVSSYKNLQRWSKETRSKDWYTRCHKSYDAVLEAMAAAKK